MKGDLRVGEWVVSPLRRTIERDDSSVQVKPKSMSVFECLVAARGEPVSRGDLLQAVWPGAEVSDDVLTKCIGELRRAFGDSAREPRVIETIPKLGFRLLLPAEPLAAPASPRTDDTPAPRQQSAGKARRAGLLLVVALLAGILLALPATRSWLAATGINLFIKAAGVFAPHSLERQPGIAVLPLVNFSGNPDNDYFSDGLSVEIINRLAQIDALPVTARSSSFVFKERSADVREIGRLLGVTHVLEGSVRRSGGKIRLTVQLIDSARGTHVWSGIYQRELSDIFSLQDEIARDIVHQVTMALGDKIHPTANDGAAVSFMRAQPPDNLEAYELYLKGVQMVTSNRPALIAQAGAYFDRAIALDNEYADAWAGKGYALASIGSGGSGSSTIPASVYPAAIAAFRKALEIDPDHAFATGWLGFALMVNDFKWAQGMQLMEKSLRQEPNNAKLLAVYGFYLDTLKLEGAAEVLERAYRLDPFSMEPIIDYAIYLMRQGRVLEAASLAETSLIKDRDGYAPNFFAAYFNLVLGRLERAEQHLQKARQVALPRDLDLDALQWVLEERQGKRLLPSFDQVWQRMQTERLSWAVTWKGWEDEESLVAVYNLAVEQRHPAIRSALFGPKPELMPEDEWRRLKEITGVTQFQQSR